MIAAGSAVVGWQAGSRSALVVLGVAAMYFVVLPALRAEPNLAVSSVSFLLAAGVIGVAWAFDGFVSALSGSDTSLTGRPAIWNGVWRAIDQHEWLGYGYSAFWRGFDGPSAVIWDVLPSHPPHAHNAMLDIWLELGLIGVGAVGAAVAILLVRALRLVRGPGRPKANILPLTLIVFFLAFSVTESTLVPGASLFWILFATASFSTSRATSARFARERLVSDPVPLAVRS
jgi:O-antigen ligase